MARIPMSILTLTAAIIIIIIIMNLHVSQPVDGCLTPPLTDSSPN